MTDPGTDHPITDIDLLVDKIYHLLPSGLVTIAADVEGQTHVMIASSFTLGISHNPPLASVAMDDKSTTWAQLRKARCLGISVLSTEQAALTGQLASRQRHARLNDVSTHRGELGEVFLAGARLWLSTRIFEEVPAGDHSLVLLELVKGTMLETAEPVVFHGGKFHNLGGHI